VIVLGGPNGAGKSTVAPRLLRDTLGVMAFVNADDIARGLSGFAPEAVALRAGRLMLERIAELTRERATFAFESTLAGLGMREVLARCRHAGYRIHVLYLWLPSPEVALARVRQRVAAGGHNIPERDVRRRWARSLVNFMRTYMTPDPAEGRQPDITLLMQDSARIAAAIGRAQADAVRRHFLLGQPVVVWRDGKVVEVWPSDPEAAALLAAEG
jgi:predicted ABC-type ATPase